MAGFFPYAVSVLYYYTYRTAWEVYGVLRSSKIKAPEARSLKLFDARNYTSAALNKIECRGFEFSLNFVTNFLSNTIYSKIASFLIKYRNLESLENKTDRSKALK